MIMHSKESNVLKAAVERKEGSNTYAKLKRFTALQLRLTKGIDNTCKNTVNVLSMKFNEIRWDTIKRKTKKLVDALPLTTLGWDTFREAGADVESQSESIITGRSRSC